MGIVRYIVLFVACFGVGWLVLGRGTESKPRLEPAVESPLRRAVHEAPAPPEVVVATPTAPAFVVPAPVYAPRDYGEWQGNRIDLSMTALCDESARCGLAMACIDGRCSPCTTDADCAPGEGCAVQHCVPFDNLGCRSRFDCRAPSDLCELSGVSSDPRGNRELASHCTSDAIALDRDEIEAPPSPPAPRVHGSPEHLGAILAGAE